MGRHGSGEEAVSLRVAACGGVVEGHTQTHLCACGVDGQSSEGLHEGVE